MLLTYIGDNWFMDKHSKESQKKEDNIKIKFKNLISIGTIQDSKYIGIIWSGLFS